MKAVILAGGFGTRLKPMLDGCSKPMALVHGVPFLEYLISILKRQQVNKIVLCVHFLADQIMKHFGNGSRFGVSIEYSVEDKPLGTAGAIKNAEEYLEKTFCVLNGDTYLEINLHDLLQYHRIKNGIATMSLVRVQNTERYGSIKLAEDGRITGFFEKVQAAPVREGYINAGVQVFEKHLLDYVANDIAVSLEKQIFPEIVKRNLPLYGYVTSGYFIDIGVPEDYLRFQNEAPRIAKA